MKAAVVPEVNGTWEIREVPTPRPGPGEVLVRVHACGICHNDIWLTRGVFGFPALDPVITGHEAAGEVVELGPGVTTREVGDRVGTTWVQSTCGRCAYCRLNLPLTGQSAMNCAKPVMTGMTSQGGHAEYVAVAAASTVLLPERLSYEMAAPMLCAGYTAWSALRAGCPRPHERVAVLGVGGLGHLALQFSRACGFETVAVTGTPDKQDYARKLGADIVVADGGELREAGGADVILVTGISNEAAAATLQGIRPEGRMVLATIDPTSRFTLPPFPPIWSHRHRIVGATHNGLNHLAEALDLAARGAVTPVVETFAKEEIGHAVTRAADGGVRFRAVVTY
ncbi:alcohol dehydrogenase catalytic domain-containing protein [Streptosporangium sp. NPDC051022]|uniref:alcohol dehydrogenase catalytic domain-containing protein n=1 Tax=Streptosporangium sp. NPDC051022 TaxID=3155752 RepID=UPI003417C1A7